MSKTRIVSFSELDALRQCPLKHHLAYQERWKMPGTSPALARGSAFHVMMETHYRILAQSEVLGSLKDRFEVAQGAAANFLLTLEDPEMADLLRWMYAGHCELYGSDPQWEIVGVEMPVEDWLYNRAGNRTGYKMKGKIDVLVRDLSMGGGLWIVDHKTCSNLPREKDYDFDDQSAVYTMLCRRKGLDVRGAIFNACRTKKLKRDMTLDERFKRVPTVRADRELEIMEYEVHETFAGRVKPLSSRTPSRTETGVLPPRAPDPDRCGWRCDFTEACLLSRKGTDIRGLLEATGGVQDPTRH